MLHVSGLFFFFFFFLEAEAFWSADFRHRLQEHWSAGASFYPNRRLTSFFFGEGFSCLLLLACSCGPRAKLQIREAFNTRSGELLHGPFASIWLTLNSSQLGSLLPISSIFNRSYHDFICHTTSFFTSFQVWLMENQEACCCGTPWKACQMLGVRWRWRPSWPPPPPFPGTGACVSWNFMERTLKIHGVRVRKPITMAGRKYRHSAVTQRKSPIEKCCNFFFFYPLLSRLVYLSWGNCSPFDKLISFSDSFFPFLKGIVARMTFYFDFGDFKAQSWRSSEFLSFQSFQSLGGVKDDPFDVGDLVSRRKLTCRGAPLDLLLRL